MCVLRYSAVALVVILLIGSSLALGDWTETNHDGGTGQLDYDPYWVALYNGSTPNPVRSWSKAYQPPASNFGSDPGWIDNVIEINDADTTVFAAANTFETFDRVRVTVACTTSDPSEEFGVMARMNDLTSLANLDGYGATFSANNAANLGDPLKFTLYKFVDGSPEVTMVANPARPVVDDAVFWIELIADGDQISAQLFEDTGDTAPMAELSFTDTTPLSAGYSGVICLDYDSAGMDAYYDTLNSSAIPEPSTLVLLVSWLMVGLLARRRGNMQ